MFKFSSVFLLALALFFHNVVAFPTIPPIDGIQGKYMKIIDQITSKLKDLPLDCDFGVISSISDFKNYQTCLLSEKKDACKPQLIALFKEMGEVFKNDECRTPILELVRTDLINIDLEPIAKIVIGYYDCYADETKKQGECDDAAAQDLNKIIADFADELFADTPKEFSNLMEAAANDYMALQICIDRSPLLHEAMTEAEYEDFKTKSQPLFDFLNNFQKKSHWGGDASQQFIIDRLVEVFMDMSMFSEETYILKPSSVHDLRKCSTPWSDFKNSFEAVSKSDHLKVLINKIVAKFPVLKFETPLIDGFVDNIGKVNKAFTKFDCAFTWKDGSVDGINQCVAAYTDKIEELTKDVGDSEKEEEKEHPVVPDPEPEQTTTTTTTSTTTITTTTTEPIPTSTMTTTTSSTTTSATTTRTTTATTAVPTTKASTTTKTPVATATTPDSGSSTSDKKSGGGGGRIAIVVISVLVSLSLLAGGCYVYYKHRVNNRSFSFSSFLANEGGSTSSTRGRNDDVAFDREAASLLDDYSDSDDEPITL